MLRPLSPKHQLEQRPHQPPVLRGEPGLGEVCVYVTLQAARHDPSHAINPVKVPKPGHELSIVGELTPSSNLCTQDPLVQMPHVHVRVLVSVRGFLSCPVVTKVVD
eukprot:CAMPEP_0184304522 /NCGR_PEP_ID=MMETSP1049-20130417/14011_1 /TAXON_ID=77928 /ORGANISM="Proteomonas sulcata, Strain CCMP704" /LENGTH=105 /DNA_ID=CAMNT_0026616339 /DNA_START=450 /DNA_END=767 /DNA_ORIENTATION=-